MFCYCFSLIEIHNMFTYMQTFNYVKCYDDMHIKIKL